MAWTTNYELMDAALRNGIPLNGIFFKNNLPDRRRPGGYIINLADMGQEGTHWVSLWIEDNKAVYFDSFGIAMPEDVKQFISGMPYEYSQKHIQNIDSGICGFYVIFELYYMTKMMRRVPHPFTRYKMFLKKFSHEPEDNRKILEELIKPLK